MFPSCDNVVLRPSVVGGTAVRTRKGRDPDEDRALCSGKWWHGAKGLALVPPERIYYCPGFWQRGSVGCLRQ